MVKERSLERMRTALIAKENLSYSRPTKTTADGVSLNPKPEDKVMAEMIKKHS